MIIHVIARPNSLEEKIEKLKDNEFKVFVKEPPVKGRANIAIAKAIAKYFKAPQSSVKIVSGFASKNKVFKISL